MKKILLTAVITAPLAFAAGQMSSGKSSVHPETQKNLEKAMQGEALAAAKYELFAQHAQQSGHLEIAQLFEDAAHTERTEHFKEEAELSNLVGSDGENLKAAIKGEAYEHTTMYPDFAKQADARGDKAAAERFRELAKDEGKHHDQFQAALSRLQQGGEQQQNRARRGPSGK